MNNYLDEAYALMDITRALRRDFHRHPELGFQEVRTAGIVAQELHKLGLEVTTGVAGTGVIALLEGMKPGPVVMARFDMDALPIQEENSSEYASQVPGVMHACGHDGHIAVGLTVARLLHAHAQDLAGTVKFVFQPAEEGLGGAEKMLAEGVLDNPRPDIAYGLHLWNEKPLGWLGITSGPVMSASDIFQITVTGRGGHGALPHQTVDPVIGAAQIITAVQSIVSRNISPLQAAVISATSLHAGEAYNVIPVTATIKGTIRTFDPDVRATLRQRFTEVVTGVGQALGCQVKIVLQTLTPAVVNDPQITDTVYRKAAELFSGNQIDSNYRSMVSEDMAYLMQEIPGCYFFVGSSNPGKGLDAPHHHPRFDIDEEALPRAAALMASAISGYGGFASQPAG